MLDRDGMGTKPAMRSVMAGGDDGEVTLAVADWRADGVVDIRDRDAVDDGVRIEHVDADEIVGRRSRDEALLAPIHRHAFDGDVGVVCDGDDGELVRPAGVGIDGIDDQGRRIRRFDDGAACAVAGAMNGEILAVDRHLFAVGACRDLDRVAVRRRVDRGLDGGEVAGSSSHVQD